MNTVTTLSSLNQTSLQEKKGTSMKLILVLVNLVGFSYSYASSVEILDCEEQDIVYCTSVYQPFECSLGSITVEATNRCLAELKLNTSICSQYASEALIGTGKIVVVGEKKCTPKK